MLLWHAQSLWSGYIGSDVYGCPTRWRINKWQSKSTHLYNETDAREGHSLNKYGICDQKSYNKKT